MQKHYHFIILLLTLVTNCANAGLFDFFEKARTELGPGELLISFPERLSKIEGLDPKSQITLLFEANNPNEPGVKKEKSCQSNAKIPAWGSGGCEARAVAISKNYPILESDQPQKYRAKIFTNLSGPGSYRATSLYISMMDKEGKDIILPYSSSDISIGRGKPSAAYQTIVIPSKVFANYAKIEAQPPEIGLSIYPETYPYVENKKSLIIDLKDFSRSFLNSPFAYKNAKGELLIDPSKKSEDLPSLDYCGSPEATEKAKQITKKALPDFQELVIHEDSSKITRCLDILGENSSSSQRKYQHFNLKIFVQKNNIFISSYLLTTKDNTSESLLITKEGEVLRYTYQKGKIFKFWFPGLEMIYPEFAVKPTSGQASEIKNRYLSLIKYLQDLSNEKK